MNNNQDIDETLHEILKDRFGFTHFRGRQIEIIRHVSLGQDGLVVMPTGAGKSLCYQLPALARGLTVVVSPLLALMKDQVDSLVEKGIKATFINSSITPSERKKRILEVQQGLWEILYVAPERFSPQFIEQMQFADIQLLAIDEAHCLSQWGHDFRPDYLRLGKVRRALGNVPTIALTATATPKVQEDIVQTLGIDHGKRFIFGFDRENLLLEVRQTARDKDKVAVILANCNAGTTLIYCATRKNVEKVTNHLREQGMAAGMYHGGMDMRDRVAVQEAFMKGDIPIVVATNAFGMGVDKDDVRCIIHWDFSSTIEGYYQEIGRAGRDGKPSKIILLYRDVDRKVHEFFIQCSYPEKKDIEEVWKVLLARKAPVVWATLDDLASELPDRFSDRMVGSCIYSLQREECVRRIPASDRPGKLRLMQFRPSRMPKGNRGMVFEYIIGRIGENYQTVFSLYPEVEARKLDLSREQYMTILRALDEMGYVSWSPPSRIGGVEILRQEEELDIDDAKITARRQMELKKLDLMRSYARSACRRRYLIEYFGQSPPWEYCGNCDQCKNRETGVQQSITKEQLLLVRKVLSCIVRMEGYSKGKWFESKFFSPNRIVEVLVGDEKKVSKFGFQKLSTFGILENEAKTKLLNIIEGLFFQKFLDIEHTTQVINDRQITYKVYGVSTDGWEVITGKKSEIFLDVFQQQFKRAVKKRKENEEKVEQKNRQKTDKKERLEQFKNSSLFQALRQKRMELARRDNLSKAYRVATDAMLMELEDKMPASIEEMEEISGFGPIRIRKYGQEFLDIVLEGKD